MYHKTANCPPLVSQLPGGAEQDKLRCRLLVVSFNNKNEDSTFLAV